MTLKIGELFAGYGGLALGIAEAMDAEPAWYAEFDPAPSKIMAHHYPHLTNYGDVTAVDWSTVPPVDIISGGSPCQDLSLAGARKGMTNGTRSNLWESMREAIAVIKPTYVVWENVRGALSAKATSASDMEPGSGLLGDGTDGHLRALGRVLGDLADLGYDCQWRGLRAADVGAPHGRFRVFILARRRAQPADADDTRSQGQCDSDGAAPTERHGHARPGANGLTADADHLGSDRRWKWPEQDRRGQPAHGGNTAADADSRDDSGWEQDQERGAIRGTAAKRSGGSGHRGEAVADAASPRSRRREDGGAGGGDASQDGRGGEELERDGSQRVGTEATTNADGRGCEVSQELDSSATQDSANGNPRWGHSDGHRLEDDGPAPINWGPYAPAIRRWEAVRGAAPAPTELTPKGKHRLSAAFAEWLMGVPAGWITDVPGITRNDQLKAAGNGVVPQQAAAALRDMLRHYEEAFSYQSGVA